MNHPTSLQWQMLLDITEPVFLNPIIKDHNFNMMAGHTNEEYVCNTVLCVGGWASVAFGIVDRGKYFDYRDGANKIAEVLGFAYRHELMDWAVINPSIWGNLDGSCMFTRVYAYSSKKRRKAEKLSDVWHHWTEVRDRTIEWEEKNL